MGNVGQQLTLAALITAVCALADILISRNEKEAIRVLLLKGWFALDDLDIDRALQKASRSIIGVFDIIYGPKQWSWKCFRRTIFISCFAILLLELVCFTNIKSYAAAYEIKTGRPLQDASLIFFSYTFGSTLINACVDYLCLSKSRALLVRARTGRPIYYVVLLAADVLSSYLIYAVIVGFALAVTFSDLMSRHPELSDFERVIAFLEIAFEGPGRGVLTALSPSSHSYNIPPAIGISLLSTLTTSAVFATYNIVAVFGSFTNISKSRLMHVSENLFESKALFTTLGVFVSALILAIKAIL